MLGEDVVTGWAMPCVPYGGAPTAGPAVRARRGRRRLGRVRGGRPRVPDLGRARTGASRATTARCPKPNDPTGAEESAVQDPPTRKILKSAKGHTLQFEDAEGDELVTLVEFTHGHVVTLDKDGIKITDGVSGHEITLDSAGIAIVDGATAGNELKFDSSGVTLADANGNAVVLGSSGIKVGSSSASQPLVLGNHARVERRQLPDLAQHAHARRQPRRADLAARRADESPGSALDEAHDGVTAWRS